MNELMIIDKIEKELKKPNEIKVFPLTPTHRKELRNLRNNNIGNLRSRLNTIRTLKREEYEKKYSLDIEKEFNKHEFVVETLNLDWENRIKQINKIISERQIFEDKFDMTKLDLNHDWGGISKLEEINYKRKYKLDKKAKSLEIAKEEFNVKYGLQFELVEKQIEKVVTQYEEAINFGDLEIVKKLYYIMKSSEGFFKKVDELKV